MLGRGVRLRVPVGPKDEALGEGPGGSVLEAHRFWRFLRVYEGSR